VAAGVFEKVDAGAFRKLRGLFFGVHGDFSIQFKPKQGFLSGRVAMQGGSPIWEFITSGLPTIRESA
jgi:hypothetical protein